MSCLPKTRLTMFSTFSSISLKFKMISQSKCQRQEIVKANKDAEKYKCLRGNLWRYLKWTVQSVQIKRYEFLDLAIKLRRCNRSR